MRWIAGLAAAFLANAFAASCDPDDGSSGFPTGASASTSAGAESSDSGGGAGGDDADTREQADAGSAAEHSDTEPSPSGECIGPGALEAAEQATAGAPPACTTEPGCAAPGWKLADFQPLSCGFESIYGLESFRGTPTFVALLAGWCPYCQSQIEKLEQLRVELGIAGVSIHFAVVNKADAADRQDEFTSRASFPLFQDTDDIDAWGLHGGAKDDMYIYGADGVLLGYYPQSGDLELNLSTEEGYGNLKNLLLEAAGAPAE